MLGQTRKIAVGGVSVSCSVTAEGADDCLLFLHGLQSRKEIFAGLQQGLGALFPNPQISIDLVGFGQSDKPESFGYDLGEQLEIVLAVLKQLQVAKVHVIGHSFGGMLGTLMLKIAPEIVASLVSLEGNLCFEDCGESRNAETMSFTDFSEISYPALKKKLSLSSEPSAAFRHSSLSLIPDYAFYRTSQTIVKWSRTNELLDIFQNSPQPKLMVCGKNSSFQSRLNDGKNSYAEIVDGGHFMMLDNATDTISSLAHFLQPLLHLRLVLGGN